MNSLQIISILNKNRDTQSKFNGCFPCNLLQKPTKFPSFCVVNTDPDLKPGQHWCLIYFINSTSAEFFDSFGKVPNPCIQRFLNQFPSLWINRKCVQAHWSIACAIYAILFAIQRCKGQPAEQIVNGFQKITPTFIEQLLQ